MKAADIQDEAGLHVQQPQIGNVGQAKVRG
jgi:hypothetical protein